MNREATRIARALSRKLAKLDFAPPVAHVYDPLDYARACVEQYLERAKPKPEAMLLGMNPGPWGMVQTGVPFGEVEHVRSWLRIDGAVKRPRHEHPKRPIQGLECTRSEVSGRRLWGWASQRFGTPARFFKTFFVWNYCPLAFMEDSGRNRTPDKLPAEEREPLFEACDDALRQMVELVQPKRVIGVGAFAKKRAELALGELELPIGQVLHPSPASPLANKGWEPAAERQLVAQGIELP